VAKYVQRMLRKMGERVRDTRVRRGLSQEELAHRAGVDRSYMSGIERGVRNITMLKLPSLARALRVSVRELFPDE
jgi:transcriptional regulator with XRE-family HTH domain